LVKRQILKPHSATGQAQHDVGCGAHRVKDGSGILFLTIGKKKIQRTA
jgi:hypothetical protein